MKKEKCRKTGGAKAPKQFRSNPDNWTMRKSRKRSQSCTPFLKLPSNHRQALELGEGVQGARGLRQSICQSCPLVREGCMARVFGCSQQSSVFELEVGPTSLKMGRLLEGTTHSLPCSPHEEGDEGGTNSGIMSQVGLAHSTYTQTLRDWELWESSYPQSHLLILRVQSITPETVVTGKSHTFSIAAALRPQIYARSYHWCTRQTPGRYDLRFGRKGSSFPSRVSWWQYS